MWREDVKSEDSKIKTHTDDKEPTWKYMLRGEMEGEGMKNEDTKGEDKKNEDTKSE